MRLGRFIVSFVFAISLLSPVLAVETYSIDASHADVGFAVKHLVISKTRGKFNKIFGKIKFDEKKIENSSVDITIKTDSIDTANQKRDDHLRNADFFDVEKYPDLTFKSKSVKKKGDDYVAVGTLTMHGVSKEVTLPFKLLGPVKDPWGNKRIGVELETVLDRRDYGLTWSKTMETGGLVVGNEVEVTISLEAIKAPN